jgi:hypothetical protein
MKAYWVLEVYIQVLLTPVLDGEISASGLGLFNTRESSPYSKLINYYPMKAYGVVDV